MTGSRFVSVVLLLGLCSLPTARATDAAGRLCAGDVPESVLQCYSTAYAERDSSMYAALLAPDFVLALSTHAGGDDCDYACTMEITCRMFRAPNVQSIALTFGEPASIEAGQEAGTWVIRDCPSLIRLEGTSAEGRPGPFAARQLVSLWVRQVEQPQPHFVIFREENRDPAGR